MKDISRSYAVLAEDQKACAWIIALMKYLKEAENLGLKPDGGTLSIHVANMQILTQGIPESWGWS